MGQVYQATDTKLNRQVALKILPEAFASDPDRLARFQREAHVLASLNHPGIAAIYGLEESGDTRALVLELVEGATLADRIKQGPIPIDEALPAAKQIAEALEAAHEAGVIHRDLKPANIKVKDDGTVKVLDFGLAKAMAGDGAAVDLSQSPTITATVSGTREGVILGTAAYMSPEQARGKPLDRRTDIWSFGCVLYEMLTGQTALLGETLSDTIAKILAHDPNWHALPSNTPVLVRSLLRRCLNKDPKQRLRDIGDARVEIGETLTERVADNVSVVPVAPAVVGRQRLLPWVAAVTLALITGLAVWTLTRPDLPTSTMSARFVVTTPPDGPLRLTGSQTDVAISPDGGRLVYMSSTGTGLGDGGRQLYVRDIDQFTAVPLPGTEGAGSPFFSPDGEWIGFQDSRDGAIKRVAVSGGTPLPICDTDSVRGVSWGPDDTIIFATTQSRGLLRVPASGGEPERLTRVDAEQREAEHSWPTFLPGGDAVLFSIGIRENPGDAQIAVLSLGTGEQKVVFQGGSNPHYSPTGHLLYGVDGTVRAVPFDLDRLEATGNSAPVLTDVITKDSGAANFAFSSNGSVVFVTGTTKLLSNSELVLVDRSGRATPVTETTADYHHPRFTPDGQRVAVTIPAVQGVLIESKSDIWVLDLNRGTRVNLTFEGTNMAPTWSPDGSRIAFSARRAGRQDILWVPSDGSDQPEGLLLRDEEHFVQSWSSDGRIAYVEIDPDTGLDLWVLSLDGEPTQTPFLTGPFAEKDAAFSPDGQWLAYTSDKSGQREVYVRPYPGPGGEVIVSAGGGEEPAWAPDGNELFYRNGAQMLAAQVETSPTFSARPPAVLFEAELVTTGTGYPNYDVTPDGQHFVMVRASSERPVESAQINVVQDWFEELKERVPAP